MFKVHAKENWEGGKLGRFLVVEDFNPRTGNLQDVEEDADQIEQIFMHTNFDIKKHNIPGKIIIKYTKRKCYIYVKQV